MSRNIQFTNIECLLFLMPNALVLFYDLNTKYSVRPNKLQGCCKDYTNCKLPCSVRRGELSCLIGHLDNKSLFAFIIVDESVEFL